MNTKDNLSIVLITYNRKENLEKTFKQILAQNSPIRDFDITVIDNCSNDGTDTLIKDYQNKFKNLSYVKNPINIGGNANICKAMEHAYFKNKKYFWILCDDDDYDFNDWNQVEKAIANNKDMIMVEHLQRKENISQESLINECSFLPAAIYKTEFLNNIVLQNAYLNIYNSLPHNAIICHMFNKNCTDFEIVENNIVIQNLKRGEANDTRRGTNRHIHYKNNHIDLFVSFVNSYKMLTDKDFRYKCNEKLWLSKSFFYSCYVVICRNKDYFPNIVDFYTGLSLKQKIVFILAYLFAKPIYRTKKIFKFLCSYLITDTYK